MKRLSTFAAALAAVAAAQAADDAPATQQTAEQFLASLQPQHGEIKLPGGIATLKLNDKFAYLSPTGTQALLENGWGNPPGSGADTLGMIIPTAINPVEKGGWGVVIEYSKDGHVSDADADKIDYADLLKKMQEGAEASNEERRKQGFDAVNLAGWAEPPHYDPQAHKIYWAKDLVFGSGDHHTLNYFVRVLGREGVLELNAVSGMDQLATIREDMKDVTALTEFTDGNRYADFNPKTDHLATYGLAALVAGGVAAKAGLFAKIGVLLLAAKKFIILGLAALAAFARKLFGRGPKNAPAVPPTPKP